jgi:hypothetical protein
LPKASCAFRESLVQDELTPEVLFGGQSVVGRAAQREIRSVVLASCGKRLQMVEFEPVRFVALRAGRIDERAAPAVPLVDGATNGGGNVSPAPARVHDACFGRVRGCGASLARVSGS